MPRDLQYHIYQCSNSSCNLRFPAPEGKVRWNRCPLCRSETRIVEVIEKSIKKSIQTTMPEKIPVEVLLDNVRSALNVGSVFRTADGMGIQRIYCCGITPDPENAKVKKTSLGAEVYVPWETCRNGLTRAVQLKSQGCSLWALENTHDAEPLLQVRPSLTKLPVVLVVGNELSGVDPGILNICDKVIYIPMVGKKQSYNAATAFGIAASFLLYRFFYVDLN